MNRTQVRQLAELARATNDHALLARAVDLLLGEIDKAPAMPLFEQPALRTVDEQPLSAALDNLPPLVVRQPAVERIEIPAGIKDAALAEHLSSLQVRTAFGPIDQAYPHEYVRTASRFLGAWHQRYGFGRRVATTELVQKIQERKLGDRTMHLFDCFRGDDGYGSGRRIEQELQYINAAEKSVGGQYLLTCVHDNGRKFVLQQRRDS